MNEYKEKVVEVGFTRNPKKIFDQVEQISAEMIRHGWILDDSCLEEGMGKLHLFFKRKITSEE